MGKDKGGRVGTSHLAGGTGKDFSRRKSLSRGLQVRRWQDIEEKPREAEAGGERGVRLSCLGSYSFESQPTGHQV